VSNPKQRIVQMFLTGVLLACVLSAISLAQSVAIRPRPLLHRRSAGPVEAPIVEPTQGNWSQVAKLVNDQGNLSQDFGSGVAISGDTIVVGSGTSFVIKKAAYIFLKTPLGWRTTLPIAALSLPPGADAFTTAVAISNDTIVLGGTSFSGTTPGHAYVYVKPPGGWTNSTPITAILSASDNVDGPFGGSVSISGDTIVVGDYAANSNTGAAYVYVKPPGGWASMTETAKLTASDGVANDYFGHSISVDGSTIAVGAPQYSVNSGKAYVFVKPTTGWTNMTQSAQLTASGSVWLGYSIAVSRNVVVVAAPNLDGAGAAYLFEMPVSGWNNMPPTATLSPGDYRKPFFYASSVSVSGDLAIVGAEGRSNKNMVEEGGVYVFEKPKSGWQDASSTTVLTGSDARSFADFGGSVALDGRVLVGGASYGGLFYPSAAFVFWLP